MVVVDSRKWRLRECDGPYDSVVEPPMAAPPAEGGSCDADASWST
jgi:hypothetical protein